MENGDIQKQQRERVDHERRRLAESRRRKEEEEHKQSSQRKTARENSESRESEDEMIVVEEATSAYQETNFHIQASREHWMGDLDVLIALSENQPDLKIKTKNTTSRIVIRALNRETYQALREIQSLNSKPVLFVLPGATMRISYGIVQHVPVMVPANLLKTTTGVTDATRMTVWDASTKQALPTKSIKVRWEGSALPQSIQVGHLGSYTVRPFTPDPVRCFRCQKFGHTTRTCHQMQSTCGICSGSHRTTVCLEKRETEHVTTKCSNCKGQHVSASKACPVRIQKAQAIQKSLTVKPATAKTTQASNKQVLQTSRAITKEFAPTMEDFPAAQIVIQEKQTAAKENNRTTSKIPTARKVDACKPQSYAEAIKPQSRKSVVAQPRNPAAMHPKTAASPQPAKPATPEIIVNTTRQNPKKPEVHDTYEQILDMLTTQLQQLRPLLAVQDKGAKTIIKLMIISVQKLMTQLAELV